MPCDDPLIDMAAQLQWIGHDRQLVAFRLDPPATTLVIGRSQQVSIHIDGDRSVSRRHATISHADATWFVEDADSTLGTFLVRGQRRERVSGKVPLRDGDRIGVGHTMITFRDPETEPDDSGAYFRLVISLTPKQAKFLEVLCENRITGVGGPPSNVELADRLCLSVDGVRGYLRALYDKFDLAGTPDKGRKAALVEKAVQEGWVG